MAKKERDESAFVAEGEGARTLMHELCARVWVRVCPWILLGLAGLQGCRKEKREKNVPWAKGAKASGWTFENGADVCWRPLGPCAGHGVLLAESRRRGEVSVMADAGLVVPD